MKSTRSKPMSIVVDRLDSAIRRHLPDGAKTKRSKVLEIAAFAFGYRNSNDVAAAVKTGDFAVPLAVFVRYEYGIPSGVPNLVYARDPVSGKVYAVEEDELLGDPTFSISPYGNLIDLGGLRSEVASVRDRHDDFAASLDTCIRFARNVSVFSCRELRKLLSDDDRAALLEPYVPPKRPKNAIGVKGDRAQFRCVPDGPSWFVAMTATGRSSERVLRCGDGHGGWSRAQAAVDFLDRYWWMPSEPIDIDLASYCKIASVTAVGGRAFSVKASDGSILLESTFQSSDAANDWTANHGSVLLGLSATWKSVGTTISVAVPAQSAFSFGSPENFHKALAAALGPRILAIVALMEGARPGVHHVYEGYDVTEKVVRGLSKGSYFVDGAQESMDSLKKGVVPDFILAIKDDYGLVVEQSIGRYLDMVGFSSVVQMCSYKVTESDALEHAKPLWR